MKIKMILTNRFDPDVRVLKEAEYLVNSGHEVEVLCWDREHTYKDRPEETISGVQIRRFFPFSHYGQGLKQLGSYFKFIRECKKYIRSTDYDILHCHDLDGMLVGLLMRKKSKPLIFDMHEIYEINGKKQKLRSFIHLLVSYLQNKAKNIIYVVDVQKELMSQKNKQKSIFLPNYPEIKSFIDIDKTKSDMLRVSYIGSVRQEKELKYLIDASESLNIKININGGGIAVENLEAYSRKLPLVNVTGIFSYDKISELYSNTDILYAIYPSTSEQYFVSYPTKLYEALITLTPVIVGKGTILENFLKKYDIGFTVDGDNAEAVRNLLKSILENPDVLKSKTENLKKIQFKFSWDEAVSALDKIYPKTKT